MKYSDYLANYLKKSGYEYCFYLSGGNIMHLQNSFRTNFKCIPVIHEVAGGIAAEYFNELNLKKSKAFALVTAGPGLTNIVTAIAGSFLESRELLVIGGQVKREDLSNGELIQRGIQEIDGYNIVKNITKLSKKLTNPLRDYQLDKIVSKSFTDRKGPDYGAVISPDGNLIAYLGYDDKVQTYQTTNLYLMDINGDNKREIKTNLDRSIASLKWSKDGKNLFFMYDDEGNTKVALTSLYGKIKNLVDNVGGTTIGRPYGGGSYSISNNNKIVYTLTSPYHPSDIAIYNGKSMNRLTNLNYDLLNKKDLGKVEEVWYKSSVDGRDIQGWIAKPPKFDSNRKYPLIVENHGGPISNYGARFSPEILLYSSAGYVVFYPNPRGSTSYGEEFGNLLYRNYPGDDYNDVMDGVDKMIELGYIDEDNLFVTGGSAGGIMTAWIIGKNNRFKASAVIKPVMNWISKTLVADNYFGYAHSRYEGQPWENFNHYWSFSPISLVGNVETPTMVMVGLDDLRTPPSEAKQLYHALKLRKVETVYVEIPGASHNISNRPSQLITKIDHILYWFNKYLNN